MPSFSTTANLQQHAAIETTNGPLLIIAGPGSGKTFAIQSVLPSTPTK